MEYFKNVSYTISHFFLMIFIYQFTLLRFSKKKTIWICFLSFWILNITDILKLTVYPDSELCYFIVTIIQIIVTQFTAIFISKKRDSKALFMTLSASNYVIAGSLAATILFIYTNNELFSLIGSFVVHFIILVIVNRRIREIWLNSFEKEYLKNWWELCLIPVQFYCGFTFLAFFPHTLSEFPVNIPAVMIFLLTMFISYVVVLRYTESEEKRTDIYWKNVLFESYTKGLENQYALVEQSEQNLKILRHDMRHYLNMIHSLAEQGECEEIKKVTSHVTDEVEKNTVKKYCGNVIVNAVLINMMRKAATYEADVRLDLVIPKETPVNDYEFASVTANLMENALFCIKDFSKEKKYIDVKIHCSKEYLLIEMKNEYEYEPVLDSVNGLPKSKKGGNHGLGMQSALAFADRIGGSLICDCSNGIFSIMIFTKFHAVKK